MDEAAAVVPTVSDHQLEYIDECLRPKLREMSISQRKNLRSVLTDSKRLGLGEIQQHIQEIDALTPDDVANLAAEIIKRGRVTFDEMHRLSHAFLIGIDYINAFFNVNGALNVLVRALKSMNCKSRIKAAECLCNLSLGDSKHCKKICNIGGSYLVTYLQNNDSELVYLCLWTITNLLATGSKSGHILLKMKIVPLLWNLYVNDNIASEYADYRKDAGLSLQLIATNPSLVLSECDKSYVLQHATDKNVNTVGAEYHLQILFYILFADMNTISSFPPALIQYLLHFSLTDIYNIENIDSLENIRRLMYANRVLGNLIACVGELAVEMLIEELLEGWQSDLSQLFQKLLSIQEPSTIKEEFLWFLKNVAIAKPEYLIGNNLLKNLQ